MQLQEGSELGSGPFCIKMMHADLCYWSCVKERVEIKPLYRSPKQKAMPLGFKGQNHLSS